jgi:hypothetical protein
LIQDSSTLLRDVNVFMASPMVTSIITPSRAIEQLL